MKISIESNLGLPGVLSAITSLTNGAIVSTKDIYYDKENNSVKISFQRRKILAFKKRLFSTEQKPLYDWKTLIKSVIVINSVQNYEFSNLGDGLGLSEFMILFGVQIEDGEIYLSSVEESKGKVLFEIKIKIREINIQMYDL